MNAASDSTSRGVITIVVAGALLGFGFNYLGQLSRPARGLAWIAQPKQFDSIEDVLAKAGASQADPAMPVNASPPPAGTAPGTSAGATTTSTGPAAGVQIPEAASAAHDGTSPEPTRSGSSTPAVAAVTTPSGAVAGVADPDDPLGMPAAPADSDGLPQIPDLDRPFAVELSTVKRFFDAGAAYIVDARDVEEFEEGHIPGAVNLPFSTAGTDPAVLEAIDPGERPIIIYCGGGTCEVSMSLAEALVYQHAKRKVLVYMGGYPEWVEAGYPVRRGKVEVQG